MTSLVVFLYFDDTFVRGILGLPSVLCALYDRNVGSETLGTGGGPWPTNEIVGSPFADSPTIGGLIFKFTRQDH